MKLLPALFAGIALALAALAPAPALAQGGYQPPDIAVQRAAMQRLAPLAGEWRGEAQVQLPAQMTVFQNERIEWELDGLVLVIRGVGYPDPARAQPPVFRAMAVISYDDRNQRYEFRTYAEGHATTAEARFLEDGGLLWQPSPNYRYIIRLEGDSWREIGEFSRDGGATWQRTIEMNLTRVR